MVKIEFFTMNLNGNAKQEQQLSENKLSSSSSSFLLSLSPVKQQNQSKENSTDDEEDKLSNEFKQNFSVTSLNIINNNANSNNNHNNHNNNNNNNIEKKNNSSDVNNHSSSCSSSSSNSSSSSCSSNSSNNHVNLHNTNKNSSINNNNTNNNNTNKNNTNNNNNNNDNNEGNHNYIGNEAKDEKFQFAKRLGYGEPLIYTALSRLGSEAKENELLAELIKLSDLPKLVSNSSSPTSMIGSRANELSALRNGNAPLRHIVIDGSNVALSHGNNEVFSCRGIKIAIDYFRQRGHREVTAFVPTWRKESGRGNINAIRDQDVLYELEKDRVLVFTPSRLVDGKRVACYDDRYILKLAAETDGIVVSNDNYRDLAIENSEFHKVIKERILMYTFVNDLFMPPDDPLGRNGPSLDMFLRANQLICPYGKKCTYGNKCKYRHQNSSNHPQLRRVGGLEVNHLPITTSLSVPLNKKVNSNREALSRTMSSTVEQQNLQNQTKLLLNHQYSLSQANGNTKSAGLSPSYNASPTWHQQIQNQNIINNNNNNNSNNNNSNNSNSNNLDDINTQFQFNLKVNVHGCGNVEDASNINRHKKLQRQVATRALQNQSLLTNMLANGYHLDNHSNNNNNSNNNSNNINNNLHRPLSSTISAPPQCMTNHISGAPSSMSSSSMQHQNITRIPSAPVSASAGLHVPIMQNYNILSASDSQLNDNYTQRSSQLPIQEQRRLLRFHLSSIFPQNQVDTVLKIYPNISDAKTICTALINLFPN